QVSAGGAEDHFVDGLLMTAEGEAAPRRHVPELQSAVAAGGDEVFAVGAERHAEDVSGVSAQAEDLAVALGLPDQQAGAGRRRPQAAVRAEGGQVPGAAGRGQLLAGPDIPDLHPFVPAPGQELQAVGAEGHAVDGFLALAPGAQRLPLRDVPELDLALPAFVI